MRQIFGGDLNQFDEVWQRLVGVALWMGLEYHDAEDATQEALIAVWRWCGDETNHATSPLAFMTISTKRKAIDSLRRQQNVRNCQTSFDSEILDLFPCGNAAAPGEALQNDEMVQLLLSMLPPKLQDAVWQLYAEGRPASTLAAKENVSPRAIRYRAARGLMQIQNRLDTERNSTSFRADHRLTS